MNPQSEHVPSGDPWHGKYDRFWMIGLTVFLSYLAFGFYDGTGLYARHLKLCQERPELPICGPLRVVKAEERPRIDITLDHGKGKWAIQVSSNQDEAQANETALKLRGVGAEPRVIKIKSRRKTSRYQVQVGRFTTRKATTEAGTYLQSKGVIQSYSVIEYQAPN